MKKIMILLTAFALTTPLLPQEKLNYPETRKDNVTDDYFGTMVADPYRWLEDDNSEETKEWVKKQNEVTFNFLEKIPYRNAIKKRYAELFNFPKYSAPFRAGENYFFFKNDGLQNQSVLYVQKGLEGAPELFLDPNKLSSDGTVSLSTYSLSKDGKYFAYGTASGGSDWNEFHVIEVASKKKLPDHLNWIKFSGISWHKNGFYYSRYPSPKQGEELSSKNEHHKIYYHKLGTSQEQDVIVWETPEHPNRLAFASSTEDERFLAISVSEGSIGNALHIKDLADPNSNIIPIIPSFENNNSLIEHIDGKLLVMTDVNAPRNQLVLIDPSNPSEGNWKNILPEKEKVLQWAKVVGGKLFAGYMEHASTHVYSYNLDGSGEKEIKLPALGTVGGISGKKEDNIAFYTFTSFTYPGIIYKYDVASGTSTVFREVEIKFDLNNYETKQVFYKSKDGTEVPMFIVHKKDIKLDGNNPAYLYAYGGFNVSYTPSFSTSRLLLLENGGVFVLANIRGGGEYGEDWHKAGMLDKKQNVFDDFIAAAEYLISEKYTRPEKLAIAGGSNGGLLVGTVINQRPDLFKVALPAVGVMDMLRFHKFTIGWAWVQEYGSSEDENQFKNLYAYSPMHNIREGVDYPATLVTTADHDDRVVPAHSFKYIATLQEKHTGNNPVLIRIETKAGHGAGKPTSKIIEEQADLWSFVFYNLGVTPSYSSN
jgi:prolyl oligopeptidase